MMLGLLLARQGREVVVLEKHGDFLRDFRGDTVHPSTMRLLDELGLAREFLALPHQEVTKGGVTTDDGTYELADFGRLGGGFPFLAFVPQWDLLDFLADRAARFPGFTLRMDAEAVGLLGEGGRVAGVRYRTPGGGEREIRAKLTVAADGRTSTLREAAGLRLREFGAPMAVSGFRLARPDRGVRRLVRGRRPHHPGPHAGAAGPRGLLAVRLPGPQGRLRGAAGGRVRVVPRRPRPAPPGRRRPRGAPRLGRRAGAQRAGGPADPVAPARAAADRGPRPRQVADRRRGHQPGRAGRRGGGPDPRRPAARRRRPAADPRPGAAAPPAADRGHPVRAAADPDPGAQPDPGRRPAGADAAGRPAARPAPGAAGPAGPRHRDRRPARARTARRRPRRRAG